jgi:hypothetical protein
VTLFDRYPALRKAVANQYQAILLAGAAAFSALTLSPLPLLLLAGAELMVMPFMLERLKRRIEIERKHASRQAVVLTQEQQLEALPESSQRRFERLRALCRRVQENYRGLSPESQGLVADQAAKFDAVLASCLKRLWLLDRYDQMAEAVDGAATQRELELLDRKLADGGLPERVREALAKQRQIKAELHKAVERNRANRAALAAEVESLEALLQLLLQKSVAATDATAFSLEIDDVLAHVEADAASVEEMERLLASVPAAAPAEPLFLQKARAAAPPAPPPPRARERK